MNPPSPAQAARIAANLTVGQAAVRARVSESYLRDCERAGRFTFCLAQRLAGVYSCRIDDFLPKTMGATDSGTRVHQGRAGRVSRRPAPTNGEARRQSH